MDPTVQQALENWEQFQLGPYLNEWEIALQRSMAHSAEDAQRNVHNVDEERPICPGSRPTVAGLAVRAKDSGRVLMLQRVLDDSDKASGKWEFPGGHLEENETPLQAAKREWQEEVGLQLPPGQLVGQWVGSNGIYQGFVYEIPRESQIDLKDRDHGANPDGDDFQAASWMNPDHIYYHNLRDEILDDSGRIRAVLATNRVSNSSEESSDISKALKGVDSNTADRFRQWAETTPQFHKWLVSVGNSPVGGGLVNRHSGTVSNIIHHSYDNPALLEKFNHPLSWGQLAEERRRQQAGQLPIHITTKNPRALSSTGIITTGGILKAHRPYPPSTGQLTMFKDKEGNLLQLGEIGKVTSDGDRWSFPIHGLHSNKWTDQHHEWYETGYTGSRQPELSTTERLSGILSHHHQLHNAGKFDHRNIRPYGTSMLSTNSPETLMIRHRPLTWVSAAIGHVHPTFTHEDIADRANKILDRWNEHLRSHPYSTADDLYRLISTYGT